MTAHLYEITGDEDEALVVSCVRAPGELRWTCVRLWRLTWRRQTPALVRARALTGVSRVTPTSVTLVRCNGQLV